MLRPVELVICAEQADQENIFGANRGAPEPLAVSRFQRPVLLADTLEPGFTTQEVRTST